MKKRSQALIASLGKLAELGGTNLTDRAAKGELPRAHGRDREVEEVLASLRESRSVLLLGPSGAGKTAVIEEVITRIAGLPDSDPLAGKQVVQMTTAAIAASGGYLGQWQATTRSVLAAIATGKEIFLYVADVWNLREAGRYTGVTESLATHFRPLLEQRRLVVLGETTGELFAHTSTVGVSAQFALASDPSLVACFEVIPVEEPDPAATKAILSAVALDLEREHTVRIGTPAVERALDLTRRFQPYRSMPGKAVDLLGEVARAARRERGTKVDATLAGQGNRPEAEPEVTPDRVTDCFVQVSGLPIHVISDRLPLRQEEIRAYFSERVVGQPEAVSVVVDLVTLVKAELNDPTKPLGVLLFVGPTGSGKTLLAKTLAEYLFGGERRLIRFDMSEYNQFDSLPRLTFLIVEKVRQESFSVVLLDEVEKAAPQAFDLFLQAFDNARMTDSTGRSVDLRNTVFVMTSNLGSDLARARPPRALGFGVGADEELPADWERSQFARAVRDHFRPEFVNRLDRIVVFQPLDLEDMRKIARRELGKALLREGVTRRNILLDFRDEVLDHLLRVGFSEAYGARPLRRAIDHHVLLPLARRIAAHPEEGEQLLELRARDDRVVFAPIPLAPLIGAPAAADAPTEEPPTERAAAPDDREIQPTGERTGAMDLPELVEAIAELRSRLAAYRGSDRFRELEERTRELLKQSAAPSFWDDQAKARKAYAAIYHLERVTDLLERLLSRAEALAEIPTFIKRHRDRPGIPRLEAKYRELEREVVLAELEFLATDVDAVSTNVAFVGVSPISAPRALDPGDWPAVLHRMYAAWASRKGYEVDGIHEPGSRDLLLVVRGPSVDRILRGEAGIHRRQLRAADAGEPRPAGRLDRPRVVTQLARVEILTTTMDSEAESRRFRPEDVRVTVLAEERPAGGRTRKLVEVAHARSGQRVRVWSADAIEVGLALLDARLANLADGESGSTSEHDLARVVSLAGAAHVRDPRTGERLSHPDAVLAGGIDPFLVAYLRRRPPRDEA